MSQLVPCKTCKKEVARNAKICPHCGEKNPTVTTKDMLVSFAVLSVIFAFIFISLSSEDETNKTDNATNKKIITKQAFNGKWAFTVDKVELQCHNDDGIISPVVVVKDKIYGLTSFASQKYGNAKLEDIWLKNSNIPGTHIDVSDTKKLCD